MISIFTDRSEFINDIADVARLFLAPDEIIAVPERPLDGDYIAVTCGQCSGTIEAHAEFCARGEITRASRGTDEPYSNELEKKRLVKRALKLALFYAMRPRFNTPLPWGALTGIRPTRLMRELTERYGFDGAMRVMLEDFCVQEDKLKLVNTINKVQQPLRDGSPNTDIDVYVNIPYCKTKCLYCSFPSQVRTKSTDMAQYLETLYADISAGAHTLRENGLVPRAFYMGGGTPTVLDAVELDLLLKHIRAEYGDSFCEFTVEAGRPDTIDREKLSVLNANSVTRISINPQSMNAATLELIYRAHEPGAIEHAYSLAREYPFLINMDVIAGLPAESLDDFKYTLDSVAAFEPDNITVHTLALKRSSRLIEKLDEYPLPDAETAMSMLSYAHSTLLRKGYLPYYMYRQKYMRGNLENVGYAKASTESIYNIDIMEETTSIMAHGANAMSKRVFDSERRVERLKNPKDIPTYINKLSRTLQEKAELFARTQK